MNPGGAVGLRVVVGLRIGFHGDIAVNPEATTKPGIGAPGGERGAGTVLVAGVASVLVIAAVIVMILGTLLNARHQGEHAADLAALDGARAMDAGADGCAAAKVSAAANHAALIGCETVSDGVSSAIRVAVVVPVELDVPGLPSELTVRAVAGTMHDV